MAHYPNDVLPTRVTVFIQDFFNTLDLVATAEQGGADGDHEEGEDDQGNDSTTAQSESLNLDQTGQAVYKRPLRLNTAEGGVAEAEYVPGQSTVNPIQGNILNFDLSDFFGSEYLSFLDSTEVTSSLSI